MEYEVLVNDIIYDRYKYSGDVDRLKMKIYGLIHWNVNFQSFIWFPGVKKIERFVILILATKIQMCKIVNFINNFFT